MSSDHNLESHLPGTLGAMPVVDDPVISDSLLHHVMDGHDAERAAAEEQFQNLELQSESGSQKNDTEAAIPHQHGPEYPAKPIDLTMDDSDEGDEDEEDYSSGDSVEVIQETQVQEEEVQSTQLAPLEASQMLEPHQESAAAPVEDPSEDMGEADIHAQIKRHYQQIRDLKQRKAAMRAREDQGPEPRNVRARVSPEQGRQVPREQNTLPRQQQMDAPFAQRLLKCGMVETQIEADGNCQFRALADQLFDGDQERYAECRAAAIVQLRSEPDRYKEFVTEDWRTYVSKMENDREWGDNITLQAAADYYKATAHVYSHDPEMPFPLVLPSKHLDADRIIRLSHKPELHYNSIHPNSEATQQQERQQQEQGPEPRNVRARVSPEQERQAPRPRQRQGTIEAFVRNDGNVQGTRMPDPGREPVMQRRLSTHPEPSEIPLPQDEQGLYDQWIETANDIIPEGASIYSDFRLAFGDETGEGRRFRENEVKAIARILFDFKRNRHPGQHAMLKGREREGKTGALFSIALAAIILRMRVVILCAPNKVAPVVDMVKKIRAAGFGKYWNVRHTLGKKTIKDNDLPSLENGQIFVAALGTVTDLKKVKQFIESEIRGDHRTVTLIDECDELTQGKGNKSLSVPHREDPGTYQQYISEDARGEDEEDDDIPTVDPDSQRATRGSRKENIAAASHYFKTELYERTQVFACSATLSGYMLNPVGVLRNDLVTPIFMVYPKPGYRGIENFVIPEGCDLETEGNLSLDQFKESAPVERMLKRFYDRENVCDGARLEPRDRNRGSAVTLRGMLFISCSPKVNVYGGVADIAKEVCNTVDSWADARHDSKVTLFVCFVGVPKVRFGNTWLKMPSGASLETIYNRTAQEARKGSVSGVHLGADEPFSNVCKNCVLIGYNMTRRAMTAAFQPADEPGVLCKLQYGIMTAPKTLTIDAVSQRFNRASHDFGDHEVPEDYCVDVAMSPVALDMCKEFRKLEDQMVDNQRDQPRIHAEFRQQIQIFANDLQDARVSKRNIRLAELSRTGQRARKMREFEEVADRDQRLREFKRWLERYEHRPGELFQESTVMTYYRIVRRLFFDEDDMEVIERRAICVWRGLHAIARRNSSQDDQYNAIKRFVEFRGVGDEANDNHDEADQRILEDRRASEQQPRDNTFRERLREYGKVEIPIDDDGNCQFRALADQLFGDQERHAELRAAAINQLRSKPEYYKAFVHDADWDSYVRRMEQDREWGDQVTLQAVTDAHKVTAHVFSSDPNQRQFPIVLPSRYHDVDQIVSLSHHPEIHYNSVHSSS